MQKLNEQENFWAGEFGDNYIGRNNREKLLQSNVGFFSRCLKKIQKADNFIEFGSNVGLNIRALQTLFPKARFTAVEINSKACHFLRQIRPEIQIINMPISSVEVCETHDIAFTKGVLIHVKPENLPDAYQKLYSSSHRYILVAEYFNPTPVSIEYRGHKNKLFKRDFCNDLMSTYSNLSLIDYGFFYKFDPEFPQDNLNWFLLEKKSI